MNGLWFSSAFMLFTLAFFAMLLLALIESLGASLQFSPAQWFERRLPRVLHRVVARNASREFPVFIFAILFLLGFAVAGFLAQCLSYALSGHFLSVWLLLIPVCLSSYLLTLALMHWLSQLMYHDQQYFTGQKNNLLGRVATLCRGDARPGLSAQARVRDQRGHLYYVEVEPEFGELALHSEVILIAEHHQVYVAKPLPRDNQLLN